jgi:protoporphyrin/coproporphyrin ferrochelatase
VAERLGVVVMAYGTPASLDDVERYYTDIRRGRAPEPHQLAELVARYEAIGGTFPLQELTAAQVERIRSALGPGSVVALGQKHSPPFVEDAVAEVCAAGASQVVGVVLAPHYSAFSVGQYAARLAGAARERGVPATTVESWHLLPEYLEFLATAVSDALAGLPDGAEVVFTAHSLPARIVDSGDPYPDQLRASAEAVATLAGLGSRWSTAWQSAGGTPEPWLGPDVLDVVRDRAGTVPGVVVCAQGFVADHLEVVYDLDVEAAAVAREVGLPFARTRSLNDDPAVLTALATLITQTSAELRPGSRVDATPA